jgi:hypothetical protein
MALSLKPLVRLFPAKRARLVSIPTPQRHQVPFKYHQVSKPRMTEMLIIYSLSAIVIAQTVLYALKSYFRRRKMHPGVMLSVMNRRSNISNLYRFCRSHRTPDLGKCIASPSVNGLVPIY